MAERKIKVYGDLTSDEKFKSEMEKIEQQGYVKTHRSNDTGIGKTLEDLLGVEENSVQAADLGSVELKANRRTSNSKITLITKAPSKRGVNNKVLRKKYGYQTEESVELNPDVNVLHSALNGNDFNTLNGKPFMKLTFQDDKMYVEHKEDGVLEDVYWKKEDIEKAFKKKYPAGKLYHVQADSKKDDDGVESFHYNGVDVLSDFSAEQMFELLKNGEMDVDIRLGIYESGKYKGKPHDNGTAIRISPKKLDKCFKDKKELIKK